MKRVAIFGAGISGLAAARELSMAGFKVKIFESLSGPGGLAGAYHDPDGYRYDKGPHYFFTSLAEKIGSQMPLERVPYYEAIYYKGRCYSFPFGLMANPAMLFSVGMAFLRRMSGGRKHYNDLKDLVEKNYGRHFSHNILCALVRKWSGFDAEAISADFGIRLLPPDLKFILYSLFTRLRGYTEDYFKKGRFMVYPKGGMAALFNELIKDSGLDLEYDSFVETVHSNGNSVESFVAAGKEHSADYYLSTIPVDHLSSANREGLLAPKLASFKYRGIVMLYLKLTGKRALAKRWYWYPEAEFPFYRISEQYVAGCESADKTVLCIEFGSDPEDPLWRMEDEKIFDTGVSYAKELFGLQRSSIAGYRVERTRAAYPILLKNYEARQRALGMDLGVANMFLAGRTGRFKYFMLEESFDSGIEAARHIIALP